MDFDDDVLLNDNLNDSKRDEESFETVLEGCNNVLGHMHVSNWFVVLWWFEGACAWVMYYCALMWWDMCCLFFAVACYGTCGLKYKMTF